MNKNDITPLEELLDSLRDIEGFPIGKDEDILALSDPPYYTACPNPYINDFIKEHGKPYDEETDDYHREPFVGDVSEGKNDPIYNAHSYHTKVPHKAIMKYIEHYTNEGDIVFDGFCGTGMTGVAAQFKNRKAILSELSPIATFIAYNYNHPVNVDEFSREANRILEEVGVECGWMYETLHSDGKTKGKINYTVWSDVFVCPYCDKEYIFYNAALDKNSGGVSREYKCPECKASINKNSCKRAVITYFDRSTNEDITQAVQVPVLINYTCSGQRYEKTPDNEDFLLISKIDKSDIPYWFPLQKLPLGFNTAQPKKSHGTTHLHHFYSKRNLWALSTVFHKLHVSPQNIRGFLTFAFEQSIFGLSKIARYVPTHYSQVNQYLSGTLYIGSQIVEVSLPYIMLGKIRRLHQVLKLSRQINAKKCIISTQSATNVENICSNSVDYIFTDPPFGNNLMYSELNFFWEAWLKVSTNNVSEAIINKVQNKAISDYHKLMHKAFEEFHRILKPKRWITVEFHNSKSSIWNSIQEAMTKAGFIIAQVSILDKKQGSFKQVTSSNAVKNDLVISAYKPGKRFEEHFIREAGENLEIDFIKQFLENLPKQPVIERTEKMLYSKMLAYYIQRGYEIRYDASSFYKMLAENFEEEDGYWFIQEQLEAYREYKKKMKLEGLSELQQGAMMLFITDEKSALLWLYNFLQEPKSFSDIHTAYTKISEISGDLVPDLKKLLEDNFIFEQGKYRRPQSDTEKQTLTQRRERELMREFEALLLEAKGSKKKIKDVRKEAILHGFEKCYKTNRYEDILALAKRLDRRILENSADINEFVEVAELKVEGF